MRAYPVTVMCRLLGVSRSGFYRFMSRPERPGVDPALAAAFRAAFAASRGTYGSRRMAMELRSRGHAIGRHLARSLMRLYGLRAAPAPRFRATTDSRHSMRIMPNALGRSFAVDGPNLVWVADITHVWTREGWLYVAVLIDLYSRRVVGWAIGRSMKVDLAKAALAMAIGRRRPRPGLVHHSDRGSQYASDAYRRELDRNGIECSMSRKGDCWDNAVAERFFRSLKGERLNRGTYRTRDEARRDIIDCIEMFYNSQRLHSYLGYTSPNRFEALAL